MPCYNPLHAYPYDSMHPKFGQFKVYSRHVDISPRVDTRTGEVTEQILIPCGKCIGCRLDQARAWATRICCEALSYPETSNWFVTATYADPSDYDGLPMYGAEGRLNDDGVLTLNRRHPTLWLKRLREGYDRHFGPVRDYPVPLYNDSPMGSRYFLAGEYGDRTFRPHYHLCLLNTPLPDVVLIGHNEHKDPLYMSPYLTDTWGFGHVTIAPLNFKTAAYVARYCTKKTVGKDAHLYESMGLSPEYTVMSRRPGIGYNYIAEHGGEVYQNDEIILPAVSKDKANTQRPPVYFDRKFAEIDPVAVACAKVNRQEVAKALRELNPRETDLDEDAYFTLQATRKAEQVKKLYRGL